MVSFYARSSTGRGPAGTPSVAIERLSIRFKGESHAQTQVTTPALLVLVCGCWPGPRPCAADRPADKILAEIEAIKVPAADSAEGAGRKSPSA